MPQLAYQLDYGLADTLELAIDPRRVTADWSRPTCSSISVGKAVRAALRQPLDVPPLDQWTAPGDRLVLALEDACPAARRVVPAVIGELLRAGVEPSAITVLSGSVDGANRRPAWLAGLAPDVRAELKICRHDPTDEQQLVFLGMGEDQQPIYLNRLLCEADLVIPVGSLKGAASWGYWGVGGQIYPIYSDVSARKRHPPLPLADSPRRHERRRREAQQVLWLLGPALTLQVISAGGDGLAGVYAGSMSAVTEAGERLYDETWRRPAIGPVELVVAGVTVGRDEESWFNLARALRAALPLVEDGGAIVLCTRWRHAPGSALKTLAKVDRPEDAALALRRSHAADASLAELLRGALERVRVLLYSQWPDEFVEQLGMGAVGSAHEIERLASQCSSCVLLGHAQLPEVA